MKIESVQNVIDTNIKILQGNTFPVILYGAGSGGRSGYEYLISQGVKNIFCFCDDYCISKEKVKGLQIKTIEEVDQELEAYIVVITCRDVVGVKKKLQAKKLVNLKNILFLNVLVTNDVFDYKIYRAEKYHEYVLRNKTKFEDIYNSLGDELSRLAYQNIINYRINEDNELLNESVTSSKHYFEKDIINLSNNEVFLDIGSYIGDTVKLFLQEVKYEYKKIICVEPDTKNYTQLTAYLEDNHVKNSSVYNKGIWSKEGKLIFYSSASEGSSLVFENNAYKVEDTHYVEVISVDEITKREGPVSFIKIDVEGAEMECLKGAIETIRRDKPILAIAAYHKRQDMIEIPEFIKSIDENYEIYFRHYRNDACDTLFYAIYKGEK